MKKLAKRGKDTEYYMHLYKMKNILKTHVKFIIGFVIGISLTTSVYAAIKYDSVNVSYDNTSSGLSSTNVQDAIDELKTATNSC